MKKIITFGLSVMMITSLFLIPKKKIHGLQVDISEDKNEQYLTENRAISVLEEQIELYILAIKNEDLADEDEAISPKDYLTKKLIEDNFTETEILEAFEKVLEKREEKVVDLANNYIKDDNTLSKKVLITQLEIDVFSIDEIDYAIEHIDVDWQEQAKNAAEKYINQTVQLDNKQILILSRKSLGRYLVEEKIFDRDEVIKGIQKAEIDWQKQAFKQAKYYLNQDSYSKEKLLEKIVAEKFTRSEAINAIKRIAPNWKEQAKRKAESYLEKTVTSSKNELLKYLQHEGFTIDEALSAVNYFFKEVKAEKPTKEKEEDINQERLTSNSMASENPSFQDTVGHLQYSVISNNHVSQLSNENKSIEFSSLEENQAKQISKMQTTSKTPDNATNEETEVLPEEMEKVEENNLFNNPLFGPFIIVAIVGNLYLYQKM